MFAKGNPPTEVEAGKEPYLVYKLFKYAKEIKKRLDLVNETRGIEKEKLKNNYINWLLRNITTECEEYIKTFRSLPEDVFQYMDDSYRSDEEVPSDLNSLVNLILEQEKRELELGDNYTTWMQNTFNGHNMSLYVLNLLVNLLNKELRDSNQMIESANYQPNKPNMDIVRNNINIYNGPYVDVHNNKVVNHNNDKPTVQVQDNETVNEEKKQEKITTEPETITERDNIVNELMALADNGPWVNGITVDDIKKMIKNVLGMGETHLNEEMREMSEKLWHKLEHGRGNRVRVTWQNIAGYLWNKKILNAISAPELNKKFFGDKNGYNNINKGRYTTLSKIAPLLDAFAPKIKKKK